MSRIPINVGTVANDGTGDPLRTAFIKVNTNFTEVYAILPVDTGGNPIPAAPVNNPVFTGDPKAPTAAPGDNDSSIATTAFVTQAVTAATALMAPINNPTFTGDPKAPTPNPGDNDTSIATTAFVTGALNTGLALKADINSPTFTGDPKAPTPAVGDNDTSIATTAWVKSQGFSTGTDLSGLAPLASPVFTGNPQSTTAPPAGDSDTSIPTTAWVQAEIASHGFTPSTTPPPTPVPGQFWYDLTTGVLAIWINDGNSSQWVGVSAFVTGA